MLVRSLQGACSACTKGFLQHFKRCSAGVLMAKWGGQTNFQHQFLLIATSQVGWCRLVSGRVDRAVSKVGGSSSVSNLASLQAVTVISMA